MGSLIWKTLHSTGTATQLPRGAITNAESRTKNIEIVYAKSQQLRFHFDLTVLDSYCTRRSVTVLYMYAELTAATKFLHQPSCGGESSPNTSIALEPFPSFDEVTSRKPRTVCKVCAHWSRFLKSNFKPTNPTTHLSFVSIRLIYGPLNQTNDDQSSWIYDLIALAEQPTWGARCS